MKYHVSVRGDLKNWDDDCVGDTKRQEATFPGESPEDNISARHMGDKVGDAEVRPCNICCAKRGLFSHTQNLNFN